jgi:hypothetical protein
VIVSPSRSEAMSSFSPPGTAAHSYSGEIVRTVLLWKAWIVVPALRS